MKRLVAVAAILAIAGLGLTLTPQAGASTDILTGKFLAAAGDIACAPGSSAPDSTNCREGETGALFGSGILHTSNLQGVLPLGDEQYSNLSSCPGQSVCGGVLADFNDTTFSCFSHQCGYDKAWGSVSPSVVDPTPGDHDYQDNQDGSGCRLGSGGTTPNACGFNAYFGNNVAAPATPGPSSNEAGDSAGDYWVTFDPAASHPLTLIVLNSGQCFADNTPCKATGSVSTWLLNTLESTTINPAKDCTVIVTADSRWSYYDHGDDANVGGGLWKTALNAAISHGQLPDLWLSSHDHLYENYEAGIDVNGGNNGTGGVNNGTYDPYSSTVYLRETVVGTGGHDMTSLASHSGTIQPTFVDNTNVVGGVHYSNFGVLQLVYDSTSGNLRSEFFEAYPGTSGVDDTGTWDCRTH